MAGPLSGIKVLDATRILSGPYCTMVLSDMGAEVLKVEHPDGGDAARWNGPFFDGLSSYFVGLNRDKKSLTIDLSKPEGKEIFVALAQKCDVLLENFVPGTMRKFGLDYETI